MTILGSPEEKAIPVGYAYFEQPIPTGEDKVDWGKYVPWVILGAILLSL